MESEDEEIVVIEGLDGFELMGCIFKVNKVRLWEEWGSGGRR